MRTLVCTLAAVLVLAAPWAAARVRAIDTLIADEQPSRVIEVRDVVTENGIVKGVLVNHSRKTLRDVRVIFHHNWLWKNEKHPGDDSPGRVDYYTVRSEIPPGGEVEFTYRPEPRLPQRNDGHFETSVDVVGWTEIGR